jgi:hypothetical protein
MPRKPTAAPASKEVTLNEVVLAQDRQAQNQLAKVEFLAADNVHLLAQQLGYDGACTVGALEDGIRFYKQRAGEDCMELGKRLLLLKEASVQGEFLPRLELLDIDPRAAQRFMAASSRFSKAVTSPLLKAAKSQSKMLELLVLDDEEMAELSEGGTVRGMVIDDVARMGVRELRAALREANAEATAQEALVAKLHAKNDKQARHIAKLTPDEKLAELETEVTQIMTRAVNCLRGQMYAGLMALKEHDAADRTLFMAGLVGQVQFEVTALREAFNLPDVGRAADLELAAEVAQWMPKKAG